MYLIQFSCARDIEVANSLYATPQNLPIKSVYVDYKSQVCLKFSIISKSKITQSYQVFKQQ